MASQRVYDRIKDLGGGVDHYRPPSQIDLNQSQVMQNIIVKDNFLAITRPGADSLSLTFDQAAPVAAIQGLCWYNTATTSQLLMAKNGSVWTWNGTTWTAQAGFSLAGPNNPFVCAQGVDTVLISDGVSHLQVWNGVSFTDTGGSSGTPNLNPPIGATILVWHAGRMFASGFASSPDTVACSNLLAYDSGNWNSVNQSFRIGDGDGEAVVFMASLQNFNLGVLKDNSVWLVNCDPSLNIANWSAIPLGQKVSSGVGCVGRQAACVYENDLLFMSYQGVHSLQRMQAAVAQYQLSAPLSLPIQPYIDRINWSKASGIVAIKYQHLAIFFVPLDNSLFNNYALVWNGRLGQWTGFFTGASGWTVGAAVTTLFSKQLRLVMGNHDGTVTQWKDYLDATLDSTYLDNNLAIVTELDTRSLTFGSHDLQKKLKEVAMLFQAGNATVTITAYFDTVQVDSWNQSIAPMGATLPAILPFLLASFSPTNVYRSLEGLVYAIEAYFVISSRSGWWSLSQVTATAFMKPPPRNA
jgi:hypothetical protein